VDEVMGGCADVQMCGYADACISLSLERSHVYRNEFHHSEYDPLGSNVKSRVIAYYNVLSFDKI
jgi:hypothetical protein